MAKESTSVRGRGLLAPSLEEKDALVQSTKKVRADGGRFTSEQTLAPRDEEWMHDEDMEQEDGGKQKANPEEAEKKWKSFKAAFIRGREEEEEEEEEEDWWSDDRWKERILVQMTEKGLNVIIPPCEKTRLAERWKNVLIVKLMGRMIDPDYLAMEMQQLWARSGKVDTIDIGSGFAVVQFSYKPDYVLALACGPWLISDHYLAVLGGLCGIEESDSSDTSVGKIGKLEYCSIGFGNGEHRLGNSRSRRGDAGRFNV